MNIEEIIDKRPHLRAALRLYEKVLKFKTVVSIVDKNPIWFKDVSYPFRLIEPICERFLSIFDIPTENLVPLKEAMEIEQIDFSRLPLNETPASLIPYHEDELTTILFLISKPYFLWLRDLRNFENKFWEEGNCPICNSKPSLSSIIKDEGRLLYCQCR